MATVVKTAVSPMPGIPCILKNWSLKSVLLPHGKYDWGKTGGERGREEREMGREGGKERGKRGRRGQRESALERDIWLLSSLGSRSLLGLSSCNRRIRHNFRTPGTTKNNVPQASCQHRNSFNRNKRNEANLKWVYFNNYTIKEKHTDKSWESVEDVFASSGGGET